jgi:hypothetical protein
MIERDNTNVVFFFDNQIFVSHGCSPFKMLEGWKAWRLAGLQAWRLPSFPAS